MKKFVFAGRFTSGMERRHKCSRHVWQVNSAMIRCITYWQREHGWEIARMDQPTITVGIQYCADADRSRACDIVTGIRFLSPQLTSSVVT
jgi:hypothetical protein